MATNVWGVAAGAKAWADHVDEEEKEESAPPPANPDFPSLGEAIKVAPKAKKKGVKLGLGDFLTAGKQGAFVPPSRAAPSDKDILAQLPKAPSGLPRDPLDEGGRMGGGFKDYGGFRGGAGRDDERDGDRGGRGGRDEYQVSKADEVDDWGSTKAFVPSDGARGGFGGGERRGGGFGDRERERPPGGAADEAGDWGATKKYEPSAGGPGGFRDRDGPRPPRAGGFEGSQPGKADEEDQWSRGRGFQPSEPAEGKSGRGFGFSGDRSAADEEDRWARRGPPADSSPAAAASPGGEAGERPRLKLQPRSTPVEGQEGSSQAAAAPAAGQPKKANPFGAARPREEVLKEKGVDYHKEELKLEHGDILRDETPEEKTMKDEVEQLRKKLELIKASAPDPESIADEVATATEELDSKEKELYKLQADLDDKVRFGKAAGLAREKSSEREALPDADRQQRDFRDKQPPREGRDFRDRQPPREGGRDGGREGGRDGGREGGREGGRPDFRDRAAPPQDRGTSREGGGAFAGAPGKDRW